MTAPVLCRQCGDPVPPDRAEWATPMCHKCLRPIGGVGEPLAKRGSYGTNRTMTDAVNSLAPTALAVDYHALFGTQEKKQ